MNDKKEIEIEREELKREFPLLFGLEKKNPFRVPEQYFENAGEEIEIRIGLENGKSGESNFEVPDNYFRDLESKIKAGIKLDEIRRNSFELPEEYFGKSEEQIRKSIYLDELKRNAFSVPDDYFEVSNHNLQTDVYLSSFRNPEVFNVPAGYFDAIEEQVRGRLGVKKEAKVIRMNVFSRTFKFVAAAAAIIGVSVMIWLLLSDSRNTKTYLSAADKKSIIENPELYGIDLNTIAELAEENPDLISTADEIPDDISEEAMNEIVMDADVDINSITE